MANPILADLFRHNLWANLALLDLCMTLPDEVLETMVPGTYGTIRQTLMHIAGPEERYLARLSTGTRRRRPGGLEEANPDLATVREHLQQSGEGFVALAESVDGDPIFSVTLRGETQPRDLPASLFLVQAINHATEHRSQIMTALTQAGVTPPDLDGWTWYAQRSGTSWE